MLIISLDWTNFSTTATFNFLAQYGVVCFGFCLRECQVQTHVINYHHFSNYPPKQTNLVVKLGKAERILQMVTTKVLARSSVAVIT